MDWSRAKTILIAALLATNAVLLAALALKAAGPDSPDDGLSLKILAAAHVAIETELPKTPGKMAVLYVEPEPFAPSAIDEALAEQAARPHSGELTNEALRAEADALLERCGLMSEGVRYLGAEREGDARVVSYGNTFGGVPLEECFVRLYFSGGRFVKAERKWYDPIRLHDKKGEVISPVEALMRLLPEKDEAEPLAISGVELVYWVSSDAAGAFSPINDTALPAWKITDGAGRVRYVPGY
ncbi:MAG: hypothetical protein LBG71_02525 [Clostridiales Family XIII bacterium]|jgi:hypothetical protein|nr:hypothetical protein [Clostridiales Family XIII bacterium]